MRSDECRGSRLRGARRAATPRQARVEWKRRTRLAGTLFPSTLHQSRLRRRGAGRALDPRPSRRAGLTLIEVMLALAILGVGITVLVATASTCLSVARKARNYEEARRLLAHIELEFPLPALDIEEGSESGSFPHPYSGYTWTREVELESEDEEEEGLYRITMTVSWSERGKAASESVVTYLYAPEEKKGGTVESR
ncbi:MAG: prepilin-type N-terminal cleavage/methylation domain-containing protein [Kiritimatiellae bacterium]|nr:prepilin-type N-terminal cleavage/methylation domain-containing protein [Kiritimatiellia bacterium]